MQNATENAPLPPTLDADENNTRTPDLETGNNSAVDYCDAPTTPAITGGHDSSTDTASQENTAPRPPEFYVGSGFVDGNAKW